MAVGNLAGQRVLDLSKCGALEDLPGTLGQLTALEKLYMAHCVRLAELPDFSGLVSLRVLNLSCCYALAKLPEWIGHLVRLRLASTDQALFPEVPLGL